jgi:hypothetical protein
MRNKGKYKFRKYAVFSAYLMISIAICSPIVIGSNFESIERSQNMNNNNYEKECLMQDQDFIIMIHKIRQEDEIDPWPHGEADWHLKMYVNGVSKTFEIEGDDVIVDEVFYWEDIITQGVASLDIKFELKDLDPWPDENDIADISAYTGGGPDNTNNFPRGAVFKRTYDLTTEDWYPVDDNNDFLIYDEQSQLPWYKTSGNYDGSTTTDENDATIWFNVFIDTLRPYPPEKPEGVTYGWENEIYLFSTRGNDPDGDKIQFGWDWNNDDTVDELTGYYDPWEKAYIYHFWEDACVYYVKALAIDTEGLISEWSEPLKVKINGPNGMSGYEITDWTLGKVFTHYLDHQETQQLVQTIRQGGNVISAVAALLVAIAAICGIPLDISLATALALAIVRVGAEVINFLDQGMGVYFRTYAIEIAGIYSSFFSYIWSQTEYGPGGENNTAPLKPFKPSGPLSGKINTEYTFETINTDPNGDKMFYLFDWGDGKYNFTDWYESGETASFSHSWSKKGSYKIKVKSIDEYGAESPWSSPSNIIIPKSKTQSYNFILNLVERLPILNHILYFLNI